jgi:uroporphyrinogen-III decarboxylase
MQVATHNCGNNLPLMDMLLEAGIECYQSLQTNSGMELGYLTERWGKQLSFWGGVPVELLVGGTPEEVRAAVREAMEKGVRGRGFILGPSHSIAYGTKYDNFMAMLDEHQRRADRVAP